MSAGRSNAVAPAAQRRTVQQRLSANPPSGVPDVSGTLEGIADGIHDVSLDEGVHRLIVTPSDDSEMTERQSDEIRAAAEKLIDAQQRNPQEYPIVIDKWSHQRGRLAITPGGPDALEDGERLREMINDRVSIRVNGRRVIARWNHELARVAVLTIRFSGSGVPVELIEDQILGLVRMNRWPVEFRSKIRFLQMVSPSEEEGPIPSNFRVVRFEAQPEVVQRILDADGAIYIGKDKGTVYYKSKPLTKGTNISYKLQK